MKFIFCKNKLINHPESAGKLLKRILHFYLFAEYFLTIIQ